MSTSENKKCIRAYFDSMGRGDPSLADLLTKDVTWWAPPNHYHFAFRLRDGRICEVREHVDTLYAQRMLF